MSLNVALGLLLGTAFALVVWLEVTRELGPEHRRSSTWRSFATGALGGAVLAALIATLAIFRNAIG